MKKKKNIVLITGILFGFLSFFYFLPYLQKKEVKTLDSVTVAVYRGDSSLLIYLAEQKGLFEKNGIKVEIKEYEAGKLAVDSLIIDQADLATASESVLVSNSFKHSDLRVLSVISEGKINKLVARRDSIGTLQDLDGKRIALTKKSTGQYYLARFLNSHYLNFQDIEAVDLSPSQIVKAIIENEVGAAFTWEPNVYNIEKVLGSEVISWPAQLYNYFHFLLIAKQDWINRHPETAIRFVKALAEAEKTLTGKEGFLADFLEKTFDYSSHYLPRVLGFSRYYVYLPQSLLLELENQAIWQIENNIAEGQRAPNYLNFIYPYALEAVDSQRVTVIR